jgi:diguanylate cyclase (GGDEF)-like protein
LLPYLAPAVVFGLLIYAQFAGPFVDRVSLTVGAALVSLLVLLRQFLSQRDLLSAQDELAYRAMHDGLTGLPNRSLVLDRASQLLARARRQQQPVAALFLDVDGFKQVNDTFGHAAGDVLLQVIGQRLTSIVRECDTVGRLGGDEFVVLLDSLSADGSAELLADRILDALRQPIELHGRIDWPVTISASIGIALDDSGTADELLDAADVALYEAKNAGKNRFVVFESCMHTVAQDRLALELDLRNALDNDELFLMYQPIFDLDTATIMGVEAVVRWRHSQRGVIAPDDFIPIAEDNGSIVTIERWVLEQATRQAALWHRHGHRIEISVNVSAAQLESDELLFDLRRMLAESGLEPAMLTLEITETVLMSNPSASAHRLALLKELGVRIAIDDFGSGYSSLADLRQFPVDALKIDRSFISAIGSCPDPRALLHTLVQLGQALNLRTVGEGIEEQSHLTALRTEECDRGQGFLFARPLELPAMDRLLISVAATTAPAPGPTATVAPKRSTPASAWSTTRQDVLVSHRPHRLSDRDAEPEMNGCE